MGSLDKQVTITFNLRKAAGALIVLLLIITVFYMGRCTAGPETVQEANAVEDAQEKEGFFSSLLNLLSSKKNETTSDTTSTTAIVTSANTSETEEAAEPAVNETEEETPEETCSDDIKNQDETQVDCGGVCGGYWYDNTCNDESEGPEQFVTSDYSKVTLDITSVQHKWYGTWGEVQRINFKITNNEDGTITAIEAISSFEGYPDEGDIVTKTLPSIHQVIKKGKEQFSNIQPDNFAYAEATTEPENLRVSITLYDEDGDKIIQSSKEFDLTTTTG